MIDSILDIVKKFIPDQNEALRAATEMERQLTKQMELKSDILKAEIQNGSGRWRVRLMYLCMFFVTMHFVMYDLIPYIRTVFDLNFYTPEAPFNGEFWQFLKIGVGGYIGSRGVEKSIAYFKGK